MIPTSEFLLREYQRHVWSGWVEKGVLGDKQRLFLQTMDACQISEGHVYNTKRPHGCKMAIQGEANHIMAAMEWRQPQNGQTD